MIGLHLLLLAFAVSMAAPRLLTGAGWVYRSPRLGIAAWYATLLSITTAGLGAAVALLAPWRASAAPVCVAWRWLASAAQGGSGVTGRLIFSIVFTVAAVLAGRMLVGVARARRAAARRRQAHVDTLDLAGRRAPDLGVTILEHPQPAAYVVAGRSRRIVVTTGAVDRLAPDELAAVVAHERAHAAGRHDLIIDGIRLAQRMFPKSTLLIRARAELARLVEMRADDVATRSHARVSLARALVAMAATATAPTPADAPLVLAATGGDALARMNRLLQPPAPLRRPHSVVLVTVLALLGAAPLGLLVAAQFMPILSMCPRLS